MPVFGVTAACSTLVAGALLARVPRVKLLAGCHWIMGVGAALPAALAATRNVSVIALTAYATARALACLVNPSPVVTVTSGLNIVGVPARAGIVKLQKGGRIAWL